MPYSCPLFRVISEPKISDLLAMYVSVDLPVGSEVVHIKGRVPSDFVLNYLENGNKIGKERNFEAENLLDSFVDVSVAVDGYKRLVIEDNVS